MHDVVLNGLEEYLSGSARRDFQAHLDECTECRREVEEFSGISGLLTALHAEEAPAVEPGFYFRVTQTIEAQKPAPSPWSLISIGAAFGRRVAFASLMMLALAGGLLISRESSIGPEEAAQPGPIAIMASHDSHVDHPAGADRDRMMLTLATYNH